ncbi:MAG: hypothetical protein RR624_09430 [Longicatena sp.]
MKNKKLKTIISYLFTFFIAFFMFVIVLATTARFTLMSPSYFMKQMNKVEYYNNTTIELNRTFKQNAAPSGFPITLFENYIKEEDIRSDMVAYETAIFDGKKASIPTDKIQKRLINDTNKYITEQKITMNPSIQVAVDQFINANVEKYSYLTSFPYLDVYAKLIKTFQKVYIVVLPILVVSTLILFILIRKMYRSKRRMKRFYAYGFLGAGLLTSVLPMYLYASRFFEKINLNPKYMYELLVALAKNFLLYNILIGLVLVVIGLLISFVKFKKKNGKDERTYVESELFSSFAIDERE